MFGKLTNRFWKVKSNPVCWSLFLIKLQGSMKASNFVKKKLYYMCFPVNITKSLKTSILKNICKRLLLERYCETKFRFTFYIQKLIFYLCKKIILYKQMSFFNATLRCHYVKILRFVLYIYLVIREVKWIEALFPIKILYKFCRI